MADRDLRPYDPETAADLLATVLLKARARRQRAGLAIPGGRSPGPTLAALAKRIGEAAGDLDLFWVDERAVPRGDPRRNDVAALDTWVAAGALPVAHPMPAEAEDLEAAAAAHAVELEAVTGGRGLDAVLLGFGEDGHIASLFPGHPALAATGPVLVVRDAPKPPPTRLSLDLATISAAELVVVVAPDGEKAALLRSWIELGARPPCLLTPADRTVYLAGHAA